MLSIQYFGQISNIKSNILYLYFTSKMKKLKRLLNYQEGFRCK